MSKLTQRQEQLVAQVDAADNRYRDAKVNARKRALEAVEREVEQFSIARDLAVWEAVNGGVPKRQVGLAGLKTTSPNTVQDIYNRAVERQVSVGVELAEYEVTAPSYSWSERFLFPLAVFPYWFLLVEGDDHVARVGDVPEHAGYLYADMLGGGFQWVGDKPSLDAQEWVKKNKPPEG